MPITTHHTSSATLPLRDTLTGLSSTTPFLQLGHRDDGAPSTCSLLFIGRSCQCGKWPRCCTGIQACRCSQQDECTGAKNLGSSRVRQTRYARPSSRVLARCCLLNSDRVKGTKRNTHNLTEETRKKNRRSRRCECPMYCVASKNAGGLWELSVRHSEHNHEPYEPPVKKKKGRSLAGEDIEHTLISEIELIPQHTSDLVNLPLLQTPSSCTADFCLVPMGTPSPSVSAEIAEVQRLLKRSGLHFSMHAAGTTVGRFTRSNLITPTNSLTQREPGTM